jgi:DNA polymerase II small subunit
MQNKIKGLIAGGLLISSFHSQGRPPTQTNTNQGVGCVEIMESYEEKNTKTTITDFVTLYNNRYLLLQKILRQRQELQGATTIRKAQTATDNETITFIGIVLEKATTKNGNIILTFEDQTDIIKGIITKSKPDLFDIAKDTTEDEVVGVVGVKKEKVVFVNSLINPDVPLIKELKKSPEEEAAVFIGDLHVGSKSFLRPQLEKFFSWLNQSTGTEKQKELVNKIKYLFVLGDIVEGVGIYPEQEKDLEIKDIKEQYALFESFILTVPDHIKIIICPGNHDSLRIAEPQPPIPKEFFEKISKKENIYFVSSPSTIRIAKTPTFAGFDFLIYHGYSFPYFADAIETIRASGGLENTDNIMTHLLKKRHLAPTHGSTQNQLGYNTDPLVIKNVPDFFASGHIHRASIKNYRNITLLNCSCWVSQTEYQEKRGLNPQPARAIYINLKTRESKILNFTEI